MTSPYKVPFALSPKSKKSHDMLNSDYIGSAVCDLNAFCMNLEENASNQVVFEIKHSLLGVSFKKKPVSVFEFELVLSCLVFTG